MFDDRRCSRLPLSLALSYYEIKGSNSYSKMVARYRQDLLAVHAASEAAR
jgi:hypothetical protein